MTPEQAAIVAEMVVQNVLGVPNHTSDLFVYVMDALKPYITEGVTRTPSHGTSNKGPRCEDQVGMLHEWMDAKDKMCDLTEKVHALCRAMALIQHLLCTERIGDRHHMGDWLQDAADPIDFKDYCDNEGNSIYGQEKGESKGSGEIRDGTDYSDPGF